MFLVFKFSVRPQLIFPKLIRECVQYTFNIPAYSLTCFFTFWMHLLKLVFFSLDLYSQISLCICLNRINSDSLHEKFCPQQQIHRKSAQNANINNNIVDIDVLRHRWTWRLFCLFVQYDGRKDMHKSKHRGIQHIRLIYSYLQ